MPVNVSRSSALLAVCALVAVLVLAGNRLARTGTASAPPDIVAPLERVSASTPQRLVVHVVGAVQRPGLYRLRDGTRVADAVARAGGAIRGADLAALNLAAPLVDGTQVLVPQRVAVAAGSAAGAAPTGEASTGSLAVGAAGVAKVSLGRATLEQLDELPGVGPITAQKILDYRTEHGPFRSVEDLDEVPGIGPARIEELRDLVTP